MKNVDVVVVGGGIIGLSVAHALVRYGVSRVVVLEGHECGGGATSKATGGIRAQFSADINIRLSLLSVEFFRHWAEIFGGDAGYRPVGYVFLASESAQERALMLGVNTQRALGVRVEWLGPQRLAQVIGDVRLDGVRGGTFAHDDGIGDPGSAMSSLVRSCLDRKVTIVEGAQVTAVQRVAGRVCGVRSTYGDYAADVVVNAAGVWADQVAQLVDARLPITPHHRQVYRAGRLGGLLSPSPFVVDLATQVYFHADGEGVIFGGGDREGEASFDDRVRPGDAARIVCHVTERLPRLEDAPLTSMWAGLRDMTPDDVGIVGELQAARGFYIAAGFSGHGFMHAPAVGEILARLITGRDPPFDIAALHPARFSSERGTETYVF